MPRLFTRTRKPRTLPSKHGKVNIGHLQKAIHDRHAQFRHILPVSQRIIRSRWNKLEQIPEDVREHMADCAKKIPTVREVHRMWVNNEIRHAWILPEAEGRKASFAFHHFSTKKKNMPFREGVTWLDANMHRTTEKNGKYVCVAVIRFGIPGQFFGKTFYSAYFIERSKIRLHE